MNINRRTKLSIAAVTLAGGIGAAGAAFTATGLSTTGQAAAQQYIGGTISQSVSGATLQSIVYGFTDGTNTSIDTVTLTFADATNGAVPTIAFTGSSSTFTCEAVGHTTADVSTCTADSAAATGVTAIAVTVPSTNAS